MNTSLRINLALIFFFLNYFSFSQENLKDSLFYLNFKKETYSFRSDRNLKKVLFFFQNKNWDSVLVYSAKQITKQNQNPIIVDYCHFFRGFSFKQKKIFNEAEKEFNLISKNFNYQGIKKMFLAEIALEQNQFKKAVMGFEEVLTFSNSKEEQLIDKNSIIHNLGLSYLHLKKFKEAESYLIESLEFYKNRKDTLELVGCYGDLATLYYEQYKDDLAIPFFEKAYQLAKKTNNFNLRRSTSKNMSVVEENRKDFEKALKYRKEAEIWKDSLNNQNKIYAVAQKEKEFAVQQKQNEVDILQVQNELKETQRNIFLYSAIGLLALLVIAVYFYREKVKSNQIIAAQKETLDELNTTKDKLFSIVSHDLRSSVNALKSSNKILLDNLASKNLDALENLLHKNSTIVNGAYGLLDNLLNWALLQTEQQYFSIENQHLFIITEHVAYNYKPLLLKKELSFENSISKKEIVQADQESLKIVLRNLIDNAIKFSQPNGFIKIYSTNTQKGYTDLIVEDSGLGMSQTTRLKLLDDSVLLNKKEHEDIIGTGLGIQLIKSMIKKNNGKFNIESELGKGTKMIVSLPKIDIS
ncbi:tetratricopeptide repeat-containing sensor histidine kinase [Tenacibaculum sp. IB213877]|uniref:ATP-binding protein n=1 Tax=Tenacibaculum sp. IB213877 TaxID=3097351 RepID=UPI002A59E20B|nr:tetratricopeptide repeat-containing sensor histidine kinase [Tenacibaculum sp. IB213877]MDY0780295.1 tetratricopeptide repeat-containing sensor histidine kinase [Tenacibaculum sp. IB213877]